MYATCLHCHQSLGRNEAIEHFPIGRRLAFDSDKGRLWVVCPRCSRWNLTPIEERWEAVEDCERAFRMQKLRAQTDNVGLTRLADRTEIIRIGKPLRPEFAAWRYGSVFRRRMRTRVALNAAGAAVAGGVALFGAPELAGQIVLAQLLIWPLHSSVMGGLMLPRGGRTSRIIGEDGKPLQVLRSNLDHTRIVIRSGEPMRLFLRHSYGHQELTGNRATRALATLLVPINKAGGSASTVRDASTLIADAGGPESALARVAHDAEQRSGDFEERAAEFARGPRGRTMAEAIESQLKAQAKRSGWAAWSNLPPTNPGALHRLPAVQRLALEMALQESSEQRALDEELADLERAWREAEEIAAIADHLLE